MTGMYALGRLCGYLFRSPYPWRAIGAVTVLTWFAVFFSRLAVSH